MRNQTRTSEPSVIIMKFTAPLVLLSLTLAASEETKPVYRDAATHEEIALKLRKAEQTDAIKVENITTGEDPSKANPPSDLLSSSDIICFNGLATLIPKRAILATPANYQERLGIKPGARLVGWLEFYTANRAWITTVEVSRRQAEGNLEIAEETRKQIGKSTSLVVATLKGGPISVTPIQESAPEPKTTSQP